MLYAVLRWSEIGLHAIALCCCQRSKREELGVVSRCLVLTDQQWPGCRRVSQATGKPPATSGHVIGTVFT